MTRIANSLFAIALAGIASTACAGDLAVELTSVRAAPGGLVVSILDRDAFDKHTAPLASQTVPAQAGRMQIQFPGLRPGRYVVSVYHDENGNGQLDRGNFGIPLESWGFSNNPDVRRRPTFEEAGVEVGENAQAIEIRMR